MKKMKKLFQIVLVSSLSLLCFSCYYDEIYEDYINEIPTDPDDPNYVEIKFGADIQPIFTSNCINCHNETRDPDLRAGNAYGALLPDYVTSESADTSLLYTILKGGHQNLDGNEINLIQGWINQGAKNN
jgi:hypothetical protein